MTEQNGKRTREIKLVPLAFITTESQLKIREIRNEDNVRKWMFMDHIIKLNEHLGWINKIKTDKSQIVFVIMNEDQCPLGVANVSAIDTINKKADWAYYLTQNARGGLGSVIEYSFINFIFASLGLQKLNCEVIEGNKAVVKLHKKFLFQDEGFRKSNILKEGKYVGVHLLGLTKKDWDNGKDQIFEKYNKLFNKFSITIEWNKDNPDKKKHPLDEIEAARARNNLNWMNILRLVLELSPEHGKALVTDIRNIDKEISALTDKLISL
ncbi:MAG: UDP-4-amino-4,6-dideoxy-N-acetyl-beta-L-altrosamine N-acetyltransferase [Alphaproteobacteria bacterium]|nr:MAG: UDP-4-amino-4,6-dideoxy-N-acetyl-beta-L-altrosamine N-acetyltransferase [Alphaproteobacteria bacterium]